MIRSGRKSDRQQKWEKMDKHGYDIDQDMTPKKMRTEQSQEYQ